MKKNILISIVAILFSILIILAFYSTLPIGGKYNNDDLANVAPPIFNSQNNNWMFKSSFNEKYESYAFIPPGYLINKEKVLFPFGFIGLKLPLLVYYSVLNNEISYSIWQVLVYFLCVIVSFLISRIYLPLKKSIILAVLFAISPFLLSELNIFFAEISILFLLLLSVYFLIKSTSHQRKIYFVLSFFIYSYAVLIKISYATLMPVYFIYLFFIIKNENKTYKVTIFKFIKYSVFLFLMFIIVLSPQFIQNKQTMGSYSSFSYLSYKNVYSGEIISTDGQLNAQLQDVKYLSLHRILNEYIKPNINESGQYVYVMNLRLLPFLLFLLAPSVIFFPLLYKDNNKKNYLRLTLLFFLFNFFIFGNLAGGFGFNDINIRASFVRYLYFGIGLIVIGSLMALLSYRHSSKKILIILLMTIIILNSLILTTKYPFTSYLWGDFKEKINNMGEDIINLTEKDSVILSPGFDDGFLVGKREVFDYSYIPKEYQKAEINKVVRKLEEDNIPTYIYYYNSPSIWGENHLFNFSENFNITMIKQFDRGYYLYKIN